ncbi:MAG TPA: chemotaxis protein CheW [Acetobacteraceae bacterium]|nr:chemotaxis protein CheW [Acetobacteraceae bacterium]
MDDLLADFLTETNENLAELDVAVVTLERTPDDANTLALIFRMVHTIKGTCGFLGLPRLEHVAHAAESVLGKVRDHALSVTPEMVSLVLTALDTVKSILAGLAASGAEPTGDDRALIAALEAAAAGAPIPATISPAAPAPVPTAEPRAEPAAAAPEVSDEPSPEEQAPAPAASAAVPTGKAPDTAAAATAGTQTIRVAVEVLEDLMTLVSELVLTRNQLLQLSRTEQDSGFTAPLQRLSHITSDLQEGVMKTRMQPIGNAWNNLPRLVRDLSHDMEKKIELVMLGADTELDRQVLELIKDPLTHMVRNSGDHGLETPAERRAAGKPETGRITLNAFHEGGHIIIEISDDGRGLPLDKIRKKVLAQGLATEAELAGMGESQLQRFIFRAGFSTASVVTAVSGRGVGMDVVKTNIEKIGGTIDLKSVAGRGTTFTIKIPLTLAIVSALIVQAADERFAIPQISVVELVRAHRAGSNTASGTESVIERINDTPVLRLRDHLLPLVSLTELLALEQADGESGDATIVVVQVGTNMLGIIVDRVFDTEEIVVKPVAPILRHVTMFSGNTILGDGSVIMILDPNGIARATGIGAGGESRTAATETKETFRSGERTAMLLFRAGSSQKMAVPLGLVARLEDFPRDKIEFSSGSPVTQYRGKLMPLIALAGAVDEAKTHQAVLVFSDRDRSMGLMVDEIIDVVEDRLDIQLSGARPGLLGTAVIGGQATDVIDTGYWLTQAWQDWFRGISRAGADHGPRRVLVVEDSDFFRQLLVPTLGAAGYRVTAAPSAADALKLREAGVLFDAIVSDIEMPDMDGLAFARAVRASGSWTRLPMIALTGHAEPRDVEAGRDAGFTDYVAKFEREALLSSLQQCLSEPVAAG